MGRPTVLLFWGLLFATAAFLASLGGCGGVGATSTSTSTTTTTPPPEKIQHVVVIFQENRTPDNLFHGLPNADIANSGVNSLGQTIPLTPIPLANAYDMSHSHDAFVKMYDGGKMDGADLIPVFCPAGGTGCPPPNAPFVYVNPSDVVPYFQLAQRYTFADRMFQTNQGPSFPAHQFIISGTSAPTATSNLFAAENPIRPNNIAAGCIAPVGETVALIDPTGNESSTQYPCFEHPALTDLLDSKMISWRYYTPSAGSIWTGPNAIQHICGPNVPPPNATACTGADWTNNVILQQTQVLTDIGNGQLPAVSWVIPSGRTSDHPLSNDGSGPSWVASIVNAIGNSPYWSNTAIFITWDDWGGFYDHVPPPSIINSYEYGFRVPLIVVSPFAKPGYVSHVTHDFGSILKFIEELYNLPSLGYADAPADDLADCFDFRQTPLPFQTITAQFDASHFLNDTRPPTDPDDD